MSINILEKISDLQPTLFEEDSYSFLIYYQSFKDWHVYDSDVLSLETVISYCDRFTLLDGRIPFYNNVSSDLLNNYWSSVPLGVFKFKILEDLSCGLIHDYKNQPGYFVEGMYWDNGFFYFVKSDKLIQAKLFIDSDTRQRSSYP